MNTSDYSDRTPRLEHPEKSLVASLNILEEFAGPNGAAVPRRMSNSSNSATSALAVEAHTLEPVSSVKLRRKSRGAVSPMMSPQNSFEASINTAGSGSAVGAERPTEAELQEKPMQTNAIQQKPSPLPVFVQPNSQEIERVCDDVSLLNTVYVPSPRVSLHTGGVTFEKPAAQQCGDSAAPPAPGAEGHSMERQTGAAAIDPGCILNMIVLSQLLEPNRFRILHCTSSDLMEAPITREVLLPVIPRDEDATTALFAEVMDHVQIDKMNESGICLGGLLAYDLDGYPVVSKESFQGLRQLSHKTVVCKSEVDAVLSKDPHFSSEKLFLDDNVNSFFKFEADMITGNCLHEILRKLDREANKVRFSRKYLQDMVNIQRSMATFIPYCIAFVVVCVLLARVDLWDNYASITAASTPREPWLNRCHGGVLGECHFHFRNIEEAGTSEQLAEFVHEEFVADLWKYAKSAHVAASAVPFNGFWLIGALLIRISPHTRYFPNVAVDPPLISCDALNLSETMLEYRLSRFYDCTAWHATVVPFNLTAEQASSMFHKTAVTAPVFEDSSIIIQYSMLNPNTGSISWVTTMLSVPKFGGVLSRVITRVVNPTLSDDVIFWCLIISLILVALDAAVVVLFRDVKVRGSLTFHVVSRFAMLSMIASSYGCAKMAQSYSFDVLQVNHVVKGLDSAALYSDVSQHLLGLFAFTFFAIFIQFLVHIQGLQTIVKLVQILIPDIVGLLVFFLSIYIMFVMIAMMLFGSTMIHYSNFYSANRTLIHYLTLHFDLKELMTEYPRTGFAFYYIFRMFLTYIMMNFFIVTIIAPIHIVWLEGDLPIVLSTVLAGTKTSVWSRFVFWCHGTTMAFAEILFNSFPSHVIHFIRFHNIVENMYHPETSLHVRLESALTLLKIRETPHTSSLKSERARTIQTTSLACNDASYFLCRLAILTESNIAIVRDARMQTLLGSFDEFGTKLDHNFKILASDTEEVFPPQDVHNSQDDWEVDEKTKNYQFDFTRYFFSKIRDHSYPSDMFFLCWNTLDRIVIFCLYLTIIVYVMETPRTVTYMTMNAHAALRDEFYHQSCDDVNCTSGFTRKWTYSDNKRLEHLALFGEKLLGPQIFTAEKIVLPGGHGPPTNDHGPSLDDHAGHGGHGDDGVKWDPYIAVNLPITIRQLRGRHQPCVVPFADKNAPRGRDAAARYATIAAGDCSSGIEFSSGHKIPPHDTLLDAAAYQHTSECSEVGEEYKYGSHNHNYPCGGYTAKIYNLSQLLYALRYYVDGNTRFVAITINMRDSRASSAATVLQYLLLSEFSYGGTGGIFWTNTLALIDSDIEIVSRVGLYLLIVDSCMASIGFAVRSAVSLSRTKSLPRSSDGFYLRIIVFIAYLVVLFGFESEHWNGKIASAIAISWLSLQAIFAVFFPVAQFFFRRTSTINAFLHLTALKLLSIIPVLVVILVAFAIAGYSMWGGMILEYSTMSNSFVTISHGFLGDFDLDEMHERNPAFAMLYGVSFTIGVVIFALNLLLAIIAGCADESREQNIIFQPIVTVAHYLERRVYYGPLMRVFVLFLLDHMTAHEKKDAVSEMRKKTMSSFVRPKLDASLAQSKSPRVTTNPSMELITSGAFQLNGNDVIFSPHAVTVTDDVVDFSHRDEEEKTSPPRRLGSNPFSLNEVGLEGSVSSRRNRRESVIPHVEVVGADTDSEEEQNDDTNSLDEEPSEIHRAESSKHILNENATALEKLWVFLLWVLFKFDHNVSKCHMQSAEKERLPLPLECLIPHIGPFATHEISIALRLHRQPEVVLCTLVAFILQEFQMFREDQPGKYAEDKERDLELQTEARDMLVASTLQDAVEAQRRNNRGAFNHHTGSLIPKPNIVVESSISTFATEGSVSIVSGLPRLSSHVRQLPATAMPNTSLRTSIRAKDLATSFRRAKKQGKLFRLPESMVMGNEGFTDE